MQSLLRNAIKISACFLAVLGISCVSFRIPQFSKIKEQAMLTVAALTIFDNAYNSIKQKSTNPAESLTQNLNPDKSENPSEATNSSAVSAINKNIKSMPTAPGENTGTVIETQYGAGGEKWGNMYIKNTSSITPDFTQLLSQPLGFKLDASRKVQVLIVHTHTCEAYMDDYTGFYYTDYYPRTKDTEKSVVKAGEAVVQSLKKAGIGVIHDTTIHDDPSYTGAYSRSEETIKNYLLRYPEIKVVLDIHRDAIHDDDKKIIMKPTFSYKNKKGAQIMIIVGNDDDGDFGAPTWEKNVTFGLKLQDTLEKNYPGMTRPFSFMNEMYNTFINSGSLLVEIGGDGNSVEEARYSGELLGNALVEVLQK